MNRVVRVLGLVLLGLAGATAMADDYPDGCVSCHTNTDEQDMRLNVMLQLLGHSMAGQRTAVIPTGCNRCHADADSLGGALSTLVHKTHYSDPVHEDFKDQFKGDCRSCHKMDDSTGKVAIKSGDRNWTLRLRPPQD
ncbi:MAG: hypothetical protein WBP60_04590 [Gammaproteobacteria bacterium]